MKRYMRVRDYCKESGFPVKLMYRLCRSHMGNKFSKRESDAENSHIIITVPVFEKMWDEGELKNV